MVRFVSCLAICFGGLLAMLFATGRASSEPIAIDTLGPDLGGQRIQEVDDALKRFRNGDIDGALALLNAAVKKNAELPPARLILAQWFAAANQPAAVRESIEQAIQENPTDPQAFVVLGDLNLRARQFTEAGLLFDKAAELLKSFQGHAKRKSGLMRQTLWGQAVVAGARQDWPSAQKYLEAFLVEDPKNAGALQELARVLFQQKKANDALLRLKEAAAADPNMVTPEALLAQHYEQAGDRTNATRFMADAIRVNPRDLKTRLVAAQWSWETDQLKQAAEQADAALQLDPNSIEALVLRGIVALFQKDPKKAEECFQQAHLLSPANFAASNNLALALAEQDDEAKKRRALEYAEVNYRLNPNPRPAEAASTLGWVLYRLGRLDEAERALAQAARAGSLSADTAYYIARVQVDRGQKDQARQLLEQALKTTRPFLLRKEAESLLESLKR